MDKNDPEDYNNQPISMDELVDSALSFEYGAWGDYIVRGGTFEGFSPEPEFWDHLEVIMGRPIQGQPHHFFSCSC